MVRESLTRQYREQHLVCSGPEETVLMLYDGAMRFLKEAAAAINNNNIMAKVRLIEKAERIIDYLQSCLDTDRGGEIAESLHRLYDYVLVGLAKANLYNDVSKLEEIMKLLGTVREGWAVVCDGARKDQQARGSQPEQGSAFTKNIRVSV